MIVYVCKGGIHPGYAFFHQPCSRLLNTTIDRNNTEEVCALLNGSIGIICMSRHLSNV